MGKELCHYGLPIQRFYTSISSKSCNRSESDCVGSNRDVAYEKTYQVSSGPSFPMVWIWLARLDCATKLIHSRFIHFASLSVL